MIATATWCAFAFAVSMMAFAPLSPLGGSPQERATAQQSDDTDDEIFVLGERADGEDGPLVAETVMARGVESIVEKSTLFTRCLKDPPLDLIRKIIDGPPHRSDTFFALDQLIRSHAGCYPEYPRPELDVPELGMCNPQKVSIFHAQCRAIYDRGALLDQVLRRYAPDISLTSEQTTDPAVQARYDEREVPRNHLRDGDDKLFFEIATCMVRIAPRLSSALANERDDSARQKRLGRAVVEKARLCIGDGKIKAAPAMVRIYITDAVYRWAVAARNVDSLLPPPAG